MANNNGGGASTIHLVSPAGHGHTGKAYIFVSLVRTLAPPAGRRWVVGSLQDDAAGIPTSHHNTIIGRQQQPSRQEE
jgi:hypothetical protein